MSNLFLELIFFLMIGNVEFIFHLKEYMLISYRFQYSTLCMNRGLRIKKMTKLIHIIMERMNGYASNRGCSL